MATRPTNTCGPPPCPSNPALTPLLTSMGLCHQLLDLWAGVGGHPVRVVRFVHPHQGMEGQQRQRLEPLLRHVLRDGVDVQAVEDGVCQRRQGEMARGVTKGAVMGLAGTDGTMAIASLCVHPRQDGAAELA